MDKSFCASKALANSTKLTAQVTTCSTRQSSEAPPRHHKRTITVDTTPCVSFVKASDRRLTPGDTSTDRSFNSGDGFQLPSIGKGSPFKGFLDISIVTQKLRKQMHSQDGTNGISGAPFEFGAGGRRSHNKAIKANGELSTAPDGSKIQPKGTRFQSQDRQV
mgnify:CR=1 FL=1